MKSTELRLDNLVSVNDVIYKVIRIEKDGILVEPTIDFEHLIQMERGNTIEPIPLTEEWLVKFGFEGGNYYFLNDVIIYIDYGVFKYEYNYAEIEIKHVHQLQNLYFALIGEELTLNETL